jgi:hypothetical protein
MRTSPCGPIRAPTRFALRQGLHEGLFFGARRADPHGICAAAQRTRGGNCIYPARGREVPRTAAHRRAPTPGTSHISASSGTS